MSLLVLLPPSEGKSDLPGNAAAFADYAPAWGREVAPVLKHLRALPAAERAKFYGVSTPEKAQAAHKLNLCALKSPGLPAIERYSGVVYGALDYASLKDPAYAREHLLILSGLFGLIPAEAPIPDYKLPLNAWLTRYWKSLNAKRLAALARGRTVISLLPGAHAAALGAEPDLVIDFKLEGGRKAAGHFGKHIKGRFVRFLMEHKIKDIDGIARFAEDGYTFDGRNFVQG